MVVVRRQRVNNGVLQKGRMIDKRSVSYLLCYTE